jgi:hypothetical protein
LGTSFHALLSLFSSLTKGKTEQTKSTVSRDRDKREGALREKE